MKTMLDDYHEVSLEQVIENDFFACRLQPLYVGKRRKLLPVCHDFYVDVNFGRGVCAYLVVSEIVQVGFEFEEVDNCVISEIRESPFIDMLGVKEYNPKGEYRHLIIRTSHQFVNIVLENYDINKIVFTPWRRIIQKRDIWSSEMGQERKGT